MLHITCERDVGLFSLIQQAISNAAWALSEGRTPVAYFGRRTCYWTPAGYEGATNVWEYYFEPLVPGCGAGAIPAQTAEWIEGHFPDANAYGGLSPEGHFVTAHFGDHPEIGPGALRIPFLLDDPDDALRQRAASIMREHLRPRAYLLEKVNRFWSTLPAGRPVLGAHVRGTDAISPAEVRSHRQGSLSPKTYVSVLEESLQAEPEAAILVATDDEASLVFLREHFGDRVCAHPSIRHQAGEAAGRGPTGWIMPAYIAHDREVAARNGEEAIIEYLLLQRCTHLVHNGGSLARTVLLAQPALAHTNTHMKNRTVAKA